jgi:hypothetical protein
MTLPLCGLAALSCAGSARAPAPSSAPALIVSAAAATTPVATTTGLSPSSAHAVDACGVAEAVTEAAIARAQAFAEGVMAERVASGTYKGEKPQLPLDSFQLSPWLSCTKTPGGAWAIVLAKAVLTPRSDYDWQAEWVLDGEVMLAHVDKLGGVALAPINTQAGGESSRGDFENKALLLNCCNSVFGGLQALELFDFDRDGEPEVHVGASYGHEGVSERSDDLFTFKHGMLDRYAPAAAFGFEAMKDVTGDGLPELLMSESLSGGESCGSGFPADGSGLTFIAHALPNGAFSSDDAAARAFAKKSCSTEPAALTSMNDVLCARLWGADSATLEKEVRARFLPWDCDAELSGRPQKPKASDSYELMLSATKARVPFTLDRAP